MSDILSNLSENNFPDVDQYFLNMDYSKLTESFVDEMCEKFGYAKLTKQVKEQIFGLNAAKLYNIDVKKKRNPLASDALDKLKTAYESSGGQRENAAYGWVRADD